MGIISKEVKPVKLSWMCEECGEEAFPTGLMTTQQPVQFEHKCKNDHRILLDTQYPVINFEELTAEGSENPT